MFGEAETWKSKIFYANRFFSDRINELDALKCEDRPKLKTKLLGLSNVRGILMEFCDLPNDRGYEKNSQKIRS